MLIIPAINTTDTNEAARQINALNDVILPHGFPLERVQIDINDGTFENIVTVTPEVLFDTEVKFKVDYQLMVNDPILWVNRCVKGQADRIIGHIEHMDNQRDFIEKVLSFGVKAGFGLSIETPIEKIDATLFPNLDAILLVSYPAGAGGKKFNEITYGKIEELKEIKEKGKFAFKICLDGGINEDNIKRIKNAKVDEVAMTKRILEGDIEKNLERFYKVMY